MFLKISQNSQENTCARVLAEACNFMKTLHPQNFDENSSSTVPFISIELPQNYSCKSLIHSLLLVSNGLNIYKSCLYNVNG